MNTVYEFTREVAAKMTNYPVTIEYGHPPYENNQVLDNRIWVRQVGPETWGPPTARTGASPNLWSRNLGVEVVFHLRSNKTGADEAEHKAQANEIINAFMGFALIVALARKQPIVGQVATSPGLDSEVEDGPDGAFGIMCTIAFQLGVNVSMPSAFPTVEGSTLTAKGPTTVTQGIQVQTVCEPTE